MSSLIFLTQKQRDEVRLKQYKAAGIGAVAAAIFFWIF
jgi:hypothetical protein